MNLRRSILMNVIELDNYKGLGDYDLISNARVYNFDNAVRASKFPMSVDVSKVNSEITKTVNSLAGTQPGTGHNNFLSGILVAFDITMTNKMAVEWQRYHFQQIVSSQSTMHKITKMKLNRSYISSVNPRIVGIMLDLVGEYNDAIEKQDKEKADKLYLEILYSNPSGMLLTQGIVTNYLQLKTIYNQRKNHRLPEWRLFCDWIKTLPCSEWITGSED